jgi:hypothetical protein
LIRATTEGEVGITYRVLRDILPKSWRHPGPLEALRMAALPIDNGDWYAIARRAELYVLGGHPDEAVAEFERAGIEDGQGSDQQSGPRGRSKFRRGLARANRCALPGACQSRPVTNSARRKRRLSFVR